MTTLFADNRLVYKTLRCLTKLTSLATSACHLLTEPVVTLFVAGTVVLEGTLGLASTHPFRSSRVGAVTAIEEVNTGAFQFLLHTVKALKLVLKITSGPTHK